jgi:hypothetical protein
VAPEDDLEGKVGDWLAKQGYRLEYHAYEVFRRAGLRPAMSSYVVTSDGTPREIDVSVEVQGSSESFEAESVLLCECKYLPGSPWVVMKSPEGLGWSDFWKHLPKSPVLQPPSLAPVAPPPRISSEYLTRYSRHIGHTLIQAKLDQRANIDQGRDVAFNALQKIANAAWDRAAEGTSRTTTPFKFVFACLIVDGPLFESWVDPSTATFEVRPVQWSAIAWKGCQSGTLVDIVAKDALDGYASTMADTLRGFAAVGVDMAKDRAARRQRRMAINW